MTTLFPQIKRVDEDETSKIIKNVLFDDKDEIDKLEQILDEFMHLTEESITFSDEDDEDEDDTDSDDDSDSDSDSDSESDSDSDSDESTEENDEEKPMAPAPKVPTSWNLDQFIKSEPEKSAPAIKEPKPPTVKPVPSIIEPKPSVIEPKPSTVKSVPLQTQPSSSYIVQIDLSKLKRIPVNKSPAPPTCSNYIITAKALKHEADAEKDKTKQAIKYLESAMHFILYGHELENSSKDIRYYLDTIPLFKHTMRLSTPGSENQDNLTSLKIHTLALRSISIVYMKLYKLREREMAENNKVINSQQNTSPIQQADSLLIGIRPQLLSAYQRQMQIFSFLRHAHDYWQQADKLIDQHPSVKIFFSTIESNCGSLNMISSFSKVMAHVKCGIKLLRTS